MSQLAEPLRIKMAALEAALLQALPEMPVILKEIHDNLKQDPEQVTLLSNEEMGLITRGLMKHTNTVIAEDIVKKTAKKSSTSIVKGKSTDDILGMLGGLDMS